MSNDKYFKLANAPEDQPLAFDLTANKLFLDKDAEDDDAVIPLDAAHSVASLKSTVAKSRPKHLQQFYAQMNSYVQRAVTSEEDIEAGKLSNLVAIDTTTGELSIDPTLAKSSLKLMTSHLAWLYEAQYRQNKEILLWIGEVVLDYMARDTRDLTIEEAIEELGLLDRENDSGVRWRLKTLVRWPVVVQRIPAPIRQLPIPPTYLSEAALFAQPEDPVDKTKFCNARDALLVAVSEKPESWSRSKFVSCMKELQDHFGMERQRNEGVAALQERLIAYYRIQREAQSQCQTGADFDAYFKNLGLDRKEVASWIYNIESELQNRGRLPANPTDNIPRGDGLTQTARERVAKSQAKTKSA